MWFGVVHLSAEDGGGAARGDQAILCIYEPHKIFTGGGHVSGLPAVVRALREAAGEVGGLVPPHCGACGAEFEIPPLDNTEATCASG